ncbi:hypothetical protein NFI96_034532, partial [Prochilodus magdalenae]
MCCRRPEITILSAEPLATNWFPGASGAFPPPPPPPAHPSWASGGLTVQLPPPSYEQVIREKSREQTAQSSSVSSSSSSSSSPTPRRSTATIATQTDTGSSSPKNHTVPQARRPPKPPRPSLPLIPKPVETVPPHALIELDEPSPPCTTTTSTTTHDILSKPRSEQCEVQTDFTDVPDDLAPPETPSTLTDSSHITNDPPSQHPAKQDVPARPRPRPRSKAILQSVVKEEVPGQAMTREVKVQTLVRLKDDSGEGVFAGFTDDPSDISSNKYLQELLDAFGFDEQGFQDNQDNESDQSEKTEEEEEQEEAAAESCVVSSVPSEPLEPIKRPQPKPRTQNPKPVIAPKPPEPIQEVPETKSSSEEKNKQTLHPPVPAPRPLLTNKISEGAKADSDRLPRPPRPPVAARRSVGPTQAEEAPSAYQTAPIPSKSLVDDGNVDDQARNFSAPVRPASITSANRRGGKSPIDSTQAQFPAKPPSQRRPPRPSNPNAQVAVSGVSVSKAPASSVPPLPPRPGESRLLPLRPPPIKLSKSAGSIHAAATTSQLPSHRVPKRRPPLPPRPKPGHPLYRDYT